MTVGTATTGDQWESLSASRFLPMRLDAVEPGFRGRISTVALGAGVRIAAVEAGACRQTRTARLAAAGDSGPVYILSVQRFGPFEVGQFGRAARVTAGQAILYRSDSAFDLRCEGRTACVSLSVPVDLVGMRRSILTPLLARAIAADTPALRVLTAFAEAVSGTHRGMDDLTRAAMGRTAAGLLETLVAGLTGGAAHSARDRTSLAWAMRRFVLDHLADPELTVTAVAAAHHVSPRYVSAVFESAGLPSPAAYIRAERLSRAARLLVADARPVPVAEVGYRCGFADPATFGRAFRRRFAMTPAQWRRRGVEPGAEIVGAVFRDRLAPAGAGALASPP